MTVEEAAVTYYRTGKYNCAEAMLRGANEALNLNLAETEVHMMAGFGEGCGCGTLCGAVAAGVAILSRLAVSDCWKGSGAAKQTGAFVRECQAQLGSELCRDIKSNYNTPAIRCEKVVAIAAKILDESLVK